MDQPMEKPASGKEMKKMSIREITDEIGRLYEGMKSLVDDSQKEGEPLAQEKEEQYSRMNGRLTDLIKMRDQHYRLLDAQAAATRSMDRKVEDASRARDLTAKQSDNLRNFTGSEEYRSAFSKYLRVGANELTIDEQRAMSEGTDSAGGFLPATEFLSTLVEQRWQANAMRQVANVIPLGTFNTEVVYESAFATASYSNEAADFSGSESNGTFAKLTLKPYTLRVFTKVSNELLADAPSRGPSFNVESIIARQFGRVMGEKEEAAFLTGSGSAQPKGILSYTSGSGTTITSVTAAATTSVTILELAQVVAALPRKYRANAKWVMNDATFWKIRQLLQTQTGTNVGISYAPFAWSLGDGRLQDGEPDRLLGYPVVCANGGNSVAAGNIVAAFGDFNYFHIGEREGVSIKTAREAFLANNQTGYFGFARHDAQASVLDAFRYLKMAAS